MSVHAAQPRLVREGRSLESAIVSERVRPRRPAHTPMCLVEEPGTSKWPRGAVRGGLFRRPHLVVQTLQRLTQLALADGIAARSEVGDALGFRFRGCGRGLRSAYPKLEHGRTTAPCRTRVTSVPDLHTKEESRPSGPSCPISRNSSHARNDITCAWRCRSRSSTTMASFQASPRNTSDGSTRRPSRT
jgi:hypothetical protein